LLPWGKMCLTVSKNRDTQRSNRQPNQRNCQTWKLVQELNLRFSFLTLPKMPKAKLQLGNTIQKVQHSGPRKTKAEITAPTIKTTNLTF
jgi:hypothetical protein